MTNQTEVFKSSEGDAWFRRNNAVMAKHEAHAQSVWLAQSMELVGAKIGRVVEIGSGQGREIAYLSKTLNAEGIGVEPSREAVDYGNKLAAETGANFKLFCGTSGSLPIEDSSVDLLIFGFCLCVIDRVDVLKSMAEADRVLKPGGYMAITDFDPMTPYRRPWVHQEGLFTYKQDYAQIPLSTCLYALAAKQSFAASAVEGFERNPDERCSVTLLYKEHQPYADWSPARS